MKYSRLGKWVVVCASVMLSSSCWAVDIPFEYFYGRWVTGHQPSARLELHKGDGPERIGDYQFTSEKWRVGLSQIQPGGFDYSDDNHAHLPVPSFYLRPTGN